ncbi:MAG: DUF1554 domain-containing protein [Spirochaetales bacterium]|nr:DUF1554 domain-containing protein [Spirochaetales bacterium]
MHRLAVCSLVFLGACFLSPFPEYQISGFMGYYLSEQLNKESQSSTQGSSSGGGSTTQASVPVASPGAGSYNATQNVTLTSTAGAIICYTTDGSQPTCNSGSCTAGSIYSVALSVSSSSTVRAQACGNSLAPSATLEAQYVIDTTAPGAVTGLSATPSDSQVNLSWSNPGDADFAGVRVLRKTGSAPTNENDGTVVYTGTGASHLDSGLTNFTLYYYAVFAYDQVNNFSAAAQTTATPSPVVCGGNPCRIYLAINGGALYNGNLGGVAGADSICNSDPARPNASTYKAIIGSTTRRACTSSNCGGATGMEQSLDWVLYPNKAYVRADGSTPIGTTNASGIFTGTLTSGFSPSGSYAWTGFVANYSVGGWLCTNGGDWLDSTSGVNGSVGSVTTTDASGALYWTLTACNVGRPLYCAEQ